MAERGDRAGVADRLVGRIGRTISRVADRRSGYAGDRRRFEDDERAAFEARHGYPLDLENPRTFSEKLCWRKLYDRNPLLPLIVDKYGVRDFIRQRLGSERAEQILVPLVYATTNPADLPFDRFPDEYIIKANHASGYNLIVRGDKRPAPSEIIQRCQSWISGPYGLDKHEWAYQAMRRRVVVEPLLTREGGKPPREYKFQMFGGRCAVIQALNTGSWYDGITHVDSRMPSLTYFTPDWTWLDVSWDFYFLKDTFPTEPTLPPPPRLREMLTIAEALSKPFDYIRVDLYDTQDGIRFGELTPYHLTGHSRITPRSFDVDLGQLWQQRRPRLSDIFPPRPALA